MIAALTGTGLSAAAGLNAYIPFLIVALVARFTDVITLPATYAWIESWWAIGIGSLLLLSEVVLDKIPAVDTVNDAVQTFIRPAMGGLIFAATAAAARDSSGPRRTALPPGASTSPLPMAAGSHGRATRPSEFRKSVVRGDAEPRSTRPPRSSRARRSKAFRCRS